MKALLRLSLDLTLAAVALLILCSISGCQLITPRIITTEVQRTADGFRIVSPKDVSIKDLEIKPDGSFKVASWEAKASPEALTAGAAESSARAAAVARLAEAAAALK